jgi:hypothetical protein
VATSTPTPAIKFGVHSTTEAVFREGMYWGFVGVQAPIPDPPSSTCKSRTENRRYYGYVQTNEGHSTKYTYGIGAYNTVTHEIGNVATANTAFADDFYGNIASDGTYIYTFAARAPEPWGGLFAYRVNFGSEELEKIDRYLPGTLTVGKVLSSTYVMDVACAQGRIFITLNQSYADATQATFLIALTFNGTNLVQEAVHLIVNDYADYMTYVNGGIVVLDYNGSTTSRLLAHTYAAGVFTLVDTYDLDGDPSANTMEYEYGRPFFVNGSHLYVNNLVGGTSGPFILNFNGTSFTDVIAPGVIAQGTCTAVTGGDGLIITVTNNASAMHTDCKVRTIAAPTTVIQTIPCFEYAAITYDPVENILFVPGYGLDSDDNEADYQGVYKWNGTTNQFDRVVDQFVLMQQQGAGYGFTFAFNMFNMALEYQICDVTQYQHYAYVLNNNGYDEETKEVKVAYGRIDLATGKYGDIATKYYKGTKVYTDGGIGTFGTYLFACTGFVFGNIVPADYMDPPALVALSPNVTTGQLEELARYEAPHTDNEAWSIYGPAINGNGVIFVAYAEEHVSGADTGVLKAFTFNGTAFTQRATANLLEAHYAGGRVFMHGNVVMIYTGGVSNLLYAYEYTGTALNLLASHAIVVTNSHTGAYNVDSDGTYISVLSGTNSDDNKIYTFVGSTFTEVYSEDTSGLNAQEKLGVGSGGIRVSALKDVSQSAIVNPSYGGSWPIRPVKLQVFNGTTLVDKEVAVYNTEFANLFYGRTSNFIYSPTASGFADSGLLNTINNTPAMIEGSGIWHWNGVTAEKIVDRFALGHTINRRT